MPVYIPLIGGEGADRKRPAVSGWAAPGYKGCGPKDHEWVGLRADGVVIIDCDSDEALQRWIDHTSPADAGATVTRQTPRGYHLFYRLPPDMRALGPHADILGNGSGIDIRSGSGSYVVFNAPGYTTVQSPNGMAMQDWNPQWYTLAEAEKLSNLPTEGWSHIPDGSRDETLFGVASDLRGRGASVEVILRAIAALNRVCDPPLDNEDLLRIARSAGRYDRGQTLVLLDDEQSEIEHAEQPEGRAIPTVPASKLKMPTMPTWFWEPFILDGTATMVEGREGIGKGLLAAHLAERATAAGNDVLWFVSEDDIQQDLLPRLIAAGWDPETHAEVRFVPVLVNFSLPQDADRFLSEVRAGRYGLVIFDPVKSFAGQVEGFEATGNSDMYVRKVYEPISQAAMATGIPVITVGHWRKSTGSTKDASLGSVAWRAVPRAVVQLAGNRTSDGGAISLDKANNAKAGGVTAYHIRTRPVMYADGERDVPYFELGEPLPEYETLDDWIESEQGAEKEAGKREIRLVPSIEDAIEAIYAITPPGARMLLGRDEARVTLNNAIVQHFGPDQFSHLLTGNEAKDMARALRDAGVVEYKPGVGHVLCPKALEAP